MIANAGSGYEVSLMTLPRLVIDLLDTLLSWERTENRNCYLQEDKGKSNKTRAPFNISIKIHSVGHKYPIFDGIYIYI